MKKLKVFCYIVVVCGFSYGLGFIFHDQYFLGSTTLFLGCMQTLLMTMGKWYEEAVGILETITSTTVCIISGLYGSAIFTALVFIPLAIFSLVNWKNNENDGKVLLNKMETKKICFNNFAHCFHNSNRFALTILDSRTEPSGL